MERWLTGTSRSSQSVHDRVLAAVLFTDIVDSTRRAAEMGDEAWTSVLDRHDEVCKQAVQRFRGEYIQSTGDGMLATFDGPGRAIECAKTISANLQGLDLQIRAGIHTGEIERRGDDISGIGVHLAARILSQAADGEIWVSSTVPSLVVGSGHTFTERGLPVATIDSRCPGTRFDPHTARSSGYRWRRDPAQVRIGGRIRHGREEQDHGPAALAA